MSLLVIGVSHHNASLDLLERISLDAPGRRALAADLAGSEHVAEVVVVSTCNRTEVYVEAVTFHGAVAAVTDALAQLSGLSKDELAQTLSVHFEDRAIAHTFRVASGLDSMALGESQIRGQLRISLHEAQESRVVGPALNSLFQQALRVGKRTHTETELEAVSGSLVSAGYLAAQEHTRPLAEATVLIAGAGAMASLCAITARRAGVGRLIIANRTLARAAALAERTGGEAVRYAELPAVLGEADVVVSCIGAQGLVIDAGAARAALQRRGAPQAYLDLGLPHDIAHEVEGLPGALRLGLDDLSRLQTISGADPAVLAANDLVTGEVAAFLTGRASLSVAPTIAALRARAGEVLESELTRLTGKTSTMSPAHRREVEIAMGRLVDKLLHTPTVRVRELAASGRLTAYADALAELFALDAETVAAVSSPPPAGPAQRSAPAEGTPASEGRA